MVPSGPLKPILVLLGVLWLPTQPAHADIVWHWKDRFSAEEKAKLTEWITRTVSGIEDLVGPYPFDIQISFYRASRGDSPVPWASTVRSRRQGINFHVNPEHTLAAFNRDWTAPHELSHLLIPYVGRSNAWFAEGFASYMQYQVMHAMQIIDDDEMRALYRAKIDGAKRDFDLHYLPFAEAADRLKARRQYPTMYWGGAVYFLQVDRALRQNEHSMLAILRQFIDCCRLGTRSLHDLVDVLDRLASQKVFSAQLDLMLTRPGFPDYALLWTDTEGDSTGP